MQQLRLAGDGTFNDNHADVIAEMRLAAEAAREGVLTGVAPFAGRFAPGKMLPPAELPDEEMETEARLILSSLDAGRGEAYPRLRHPTREPGRRAGRCAYRVRATLALTCDAPDAPPRALFTRDVTSDAVGFVSPDRLPLGYGGTLTLAAADGRVVSAAALLTRCRACVGGWFEGALHFTRRQPAFEPDAEA